MQALNCTRSISASVEPGHGKEIFVTCEGMSEESQRTYAWAKGHRSPGHLLHKQNESWRKEARRRGDGGFHTHEMLRESMQLT